MIDVKIEGSNPRFDDQTSFLTPCNLPLIQTVVFTAEERIIIFGALNKNYFREREF